MANVKYTDLTGLQYALSKFLEKSDLRFLGINDNAVSADKLNVAHKINGVLFDGTADITITADPNAHSHNSEDITDLNSAITNTITTSGGTIHKHSNLTTIEKITESNLTSWTNKIGTNDVAKLLYTNVNLTDVSDVNGALNSLVTLYLAVDELANQNKEDIDTINNAENGILEQAKSYTNEIVAAQTHLSFKIISSLPTTDISTSTIYLLPVNGDTDNVYEEYIYIDNKWESIGTTQTDLINYYTKTEIDEKINTINENINKKVDKVDGMGLSQENYTTEEKTKLSEIQTITTSEIDTVINDAFNK